MLTTCPLARRSHRANASAILKSRRARRVTLLGLYYSARPLSIGARDLRASNSRQLQLGRKLGHPRNVSFTSIPTVWGIWGSGRISFRRALQLKAGWFLSPLVFTRRRDAERGVGGGRLHQGRGANARAPRARVRADAATHSRHPTLDAVRLRVPAPVRGHGARLPHLHGSAVVGTPVVSPAPGLPQDSGVLSIQLLSTGSSQSRASLPQVSNARGRLR